MAVSALWHTRLTCMHELSALMHGQEPGKAHGPRGRVFDVKPLGAEVDPDYLKFQREVEEMQQGQGWGGKVCHSALLATFSSKPHSHPRSTIGIRARGPHVSQGSQGRSSERRG